MLHDQVYADGGSQVEDPVSAGHHPVYRRAVEDAALDEMKIPVADHGPEVFQAAGREVIQHRDFVAGREEVLHEMAPDEAGSAGDCCFHFSYFLLKTSEAAGITTG